MKTMTIQTMLTQLRRPKILSILLALGIVWLVVSGVLWWQTVYTTPRNVFNGMIQNNFTTSGFTKKSVTQNSGIAGRETAQLQLAGRNVVQTRTELTQGTDVVFTESISSPEQNFVRYTKIETERKNSAGKQVDLSSALNVWAKAPGSSQELSKLLLGIMPMGTVPSADRAKLNDYLAKNTVFDVNYKTVKTETVNGRKAYVYEVKLMPVAYVGMLKIYGEAVGLGAQVSSLNQADFQEAQPSNLVIKVDVSSRRVVSLAYAEAPDSAETYSAYGALKYIPLPEKTISLQKLQERLRID